jgi:hypothetical protein
MIDSLLRLALACGMCVTLMPAVAAIRPIAWKPSDEIDGSSVAAAMTPISAMRAKVV